MATYTYDPGKHNVSINGVKLSGFADGTFIEVSRNEPLSSTKASADGSIVVRVKNRNKSGSITVTLLAESDANAFLDALRQLDDAGVNAFFAVSMDDGVNTEMLSPEGWIEEIPTRSYAKDGAAALSWKIGLSNVNYIVTPGSTAWTTLKNKASSLITELF